MTTISIKAGATLSYAGKVTTLDPAITWDAFVAFRNASSFALVTPDATITMTQATDFATSHAYDFLLYAPPETTTAWAALTNKGSMRLLFDIKFVDHANPETVIYTDTQQLCVEPSITP